jgi:hypothetical protein
LREVLTRETSAQQIDGGKVAAFDVAYIAKSGNARPVCFEYLDCVGVIFHLEFADHPGPLQS